MNWITDLLPAFSHSLGMDHIPISDHGQAALEFENGQRLYFETVPTGVCVSLVYQSNGYQLLREIRTLLDLCHYENSTQYQLRPGLMGENMLSISTTIPQEKAILSELQSVVEQIQDVMTRVLEQNI